MPRPPFRHNRRSDAIKSVSLPKWHLSGLLHTCICLSGLLASMKSLIVGYKRLSSSYCFLVVGVAFGDEFFSKTCRIVPCTFSLFGYCIGVPVIFSISRWYYRFYFPCAAGKEVAEVLAVFRVRTCRDVSGHIVKDSFTLLVRQPVPLLFKLHFVAHGLAVHRPHMFKGTTALRCFVIFGPAD